MTDRPFPRDLLRRDAPEAAGNLLGARLIRGRGPSARVGRIVEVEAYAGQEDLASHARFGPTTRNRVMFGSPGLAYVYLVYGMYSCLNVVTGEPGRAGALLVRAVEPLAGVEAMREARLAWLERPRANESDPRGGFGAERISRARRRIESLPESDMAAGPGLVCAAFSIGRGDDSVDLCDPGSDLRLETGPGDDDPAVETGPRVGIGYAPEPWLSRPWRYWLKGGAAVSKPPRSHGGT